MADHPVVWSIVTPKETKMVGLEWRLSPRRTEESEMRAAPILVGLIAAMAISGVLAGRAITDSKTWTVRTKAGQEIVAHRYLAVGKHCAPDTPPPITITEPPASGTVTIRHEQAKITNMRQGDVACVGRLGEAVVIYYLPNQGFVGTDRFSYDVKWPRGTVTDTVIVEVR